MMKQLFYRILIRANWFYKEVVKEADHFMVFFYTIFAFSMFIVFYVWGIGLFLKRQLMGSEFIFREWEMLLTGVIVIGLNLFLFWRERAKWEKLFKKSDLKFNKYDIGVIIYVTLAFFTFFFNVWQLG